MVIVCHKVTTIARAPFGTGALAREAIVLIKISGNSSTAEISCDPLEDSTINIKAAGRNNAEPFMLTVDPTERMNRDRGLETWPVPSTHLSVTGKAAILDAHPKASD